MEQNTNRGKPPTLAITALVPPELVYGCGWNSLDLNNLVPALDRAPARRLCAWTSSWRDFVLKGKLNADALTIVAGGDCHNALADGQSAAKKIRSNYFFYPFDGDTDYMREQLVRLEGFLGGIKDPDAWTSVSLLKSKLRGIEERRENGKVDAATAFELIISGADMSSDLEGFKRKIDSQLPPVQSNGPRVALLGVPPIMRDFHRASAESGLHVVFDELPHEFLRLGGDDIDELAESYACYTFARQISFRTGFLRKTLKRLHLDGAIHYTQYGCHHLLEDETLREELDLPVLTVQGDAPGLTSAGVRLRLEAFAEMLGGIP